jgi:hypothetical protein
MVYQEKLVAIIKSKGRILREHGDTVYLPFGSEYSILLKNMNTRDALVDITVDGKKVISGLIIRANDDVEVERFVDSMDKGYKLKFIEKTDDIRDFRGDKVEDGLIRISYKFEKPSYTNGWRFNSVNELHKGINYSGGYNTLYGSSNFQYKTIQTSGNTTLASNVSNVSNVSRCAYASNQVANDQGITVEGEDSYQSFKYGNIGELEQESHVIIIKLKGVTENNKHISKPLEVKDKIRCKYCGKTSKSNKRFCSNCGSRLTLE